MNRPTTPTDSVVEQRPRRLDLPGLRRRLEGQAHLFDDPRTYLAGVADALETVQNEIEALLADPPRRSDRAMAG